VHCSLEFSAIELVTSDSINAYNKGKQDAAKYEYHPPVVGKFFRELTATDAEWENQKEYDRGWKDYHNLR